MTPKTDSVAVLRELMDDLIGIVHRPPSGAGPTCPVDFERDGRDLFAIKARIETARAALEAQASAPGREVTEALKPTPMVPNGFGGQEPAFRMDAYYYGFAATGIEVIDLILSAVACAGKAFHHTEQWNEKGIQRHRMRGETPVEWIQNAANDAADAIRAALAARTGKGEGDV